MTQETAVAFETLAAKGLTGYFTQIMRTSLAEFGQPRRLPGSGAWLLVRPIPDSDRFDAMAGYRNLFCSNWLALGDDLDQAHDLVSVTAVTDPFAVVDLNSLRKAFPDVLRPYKESFVVDLRHPTPSTHHRSKARRWSREIEIHIDDDPGRHLDDWERLYSDLRIRHRLTGLRAFSREAFKKQLGTPGCVAFRAVQNGECVSMILWYLMEDVAHSHLTASSPLGYRLSATYVLIQRAIETFSKRGLLWLNLGSTAGETAQNDDGLTKFKAGWASGTRLSYLCGRIVDRPEYLGLAARSPGATNYFPAYRRGEFG